MSLIGKLPVTSSSNPLETHHHLSAYVGQLSKFLSEFSVWELNAS